MKKLLVFLGAMLLVIGVMGIGNATLIDNFDGTITQTRNDNSQLMWLKDANYAYTSGYDSWDGLLHWYEAMDFIDYLNFNKHLGYDDWRFPNALPVNGTSYNYATTYDGSSDLGYNITNPNSELAYMYYVELGNKGALDTSGTPEDNYGLLNQGIFDNIEENIYWSGQTLPDSQNDAFYFVTGKEELYGDDAGRQWFGTKYKNFNIWVVRDVTPVPEPTTVLLFVTGLVGLAGFRRKFKR